MVYNRFHPGEWITNGLAVLLIKSVENGLYYFEDGSGISCNFIDSNYHIWSLDDAEEGDIILVFPRTPAGGFYPCYPYIVEYKTHDSKYIYYKSAYKFGTVTYCSFICNSNINCKITKPATEELISYFKTKLNEDGSDR